MDINQPQNTNAVSPINQADQKKQTKILKRMKKRDHNRNLKNFGFICLGGFLSVVLTLGTIATVAGVVKLNNIEKMMGKEKNEIITEKYEDYTILKMIMGFVSGEIQIDSLEGISEITPLAEEYILQYFESFGISDEEFAAIAEIKFSEYGTDLLPVLLKSIELNAIITKDAVGEDIYYAICAYTDANGQEQPYTLYNIVNNQIYQEDNPYVVNNGGQPVEYLTNAISNFHFDTFLDTSGSLSFLKGKTVGELTTSFDQIKLKELIGEDKCQDGILKAIGEKTIGDITNDPDSLMNDVYLKDVINTSTVTGPAKSIMDALLYEDKDTTKPVSVGKLQNDPDFIANIIDGLLLVEVFGIDKTAIEAEITANNGGDESANSFTTMMKLLCYKKDTLGKLDPTQPRTLKEIQGDGNELKDIFTQGMKLKDVIEINASSNQVFKYLKDTAICDLGNAITNMPVSKMVSEDDLNNNELLKNILTRKHDDGAGNMVEYTFSEISDCIATIKIGDIVDCTSSPLLGYIQNCGFNGDEILTAMKNATISDIIISTCEENLCYKYRTVATPYTYSNEDKSSDPEWEVNPAANKIYVALVTKGAGKNMSQLGDVFSSLEVSDLIEINSSSSVFLKALQNAPLTEEGLQNAFKAIKVGSLIQDVCEEKDYSLYRTVATPYEYSNEDKSGDSTWEKNPEMNGLMHVLCTSDKSIDKLGEVVSDIKLKDVIADAEGSFLSSLADKPLTEITAEDFKNISIEDIFGKEIYTNKDTGVELEHKPSNVQNVWKYLLFTNATEFNNAKSAANDSLTYTYQSYTLNNMVDMINNVTTNFNNATLDDLKQDGMIDVEQTILDKTVGFPPVRIGTLTIAQFINLVGSLI